MGQARPGAYPVNTTTVDSSFPVNAGASWNPADNGASMPDPFAQWNGSFVPAASAYPTAESSPAQAYPTQQQQQGEDELWDDSNGTLTSSDDGTEHIVVPDVSHMSEADAAEHIFYQYRNAKRVWRRFTGKPVRRFRSGLRHFAKARGRGRGSGQGHRRSMFLTDEDTQAYLSGKGKGQRKHTSGKGHGRRTNPRDRNGQVMKCHNCGSE